ncbi:DUF481 domain-containing protein [Paraglaciecola aquimarina]|uniref:DUF481 domain-containing protein n=1 Tax=Paraglaciecola algarum TaxID=3050085 RepID=A0ABS9D9S1_9ALTE|nr:DUF481 domain-containing protein [Paraglaciecola sp. G1-23]MCF2948534.1 DUF481 domain-containing protein [Paraglaciecola sp. G1-23]
MKKVLFIISLCLPLAVTAKPNFMRSLYMADKPNYKADEELSMVGEFGFIIANGNTNTSIIKGRINASQELKAWEYQITGDTFYKQSKKDIDGESVKATAAQKLFLSLQTDYKLLNPDNRIFIYGEYEKKRFSGFRYQAAVATGWSSRLWRSNKSELKYSVGPGYAISEIEENSNKTEYSGLIVRAAMEYKRKFSAHATFRQFLSTEADPDFTKTRSETTLSTKLNGALGMKLSFVMNHDTGVAQGSEELDTQTAVTLVYQFF